MRRSAYSLVEVCTVHVTQRFTPLSSSVVVIEGRCRHGIVGVGAEMVLRVWGTCEVDMDNRAVFMYRKGANQGD